MKTPTIYYIFTYGKALKSYRNRHLNGAKSESAHINKKKSHTYTHELEKQRHRQWLNVIASSSWILGSPWIEEKNNNKKRLMRRDLIERIQLCVLVYVDMYVWSKLGKNRQQKNKNKKVVKCVFLCLFLPMTMKEKPTLNSTFSNICVPQIFYADFFFAQIIFWLWARAR